MYVSPFLRTTQTAEQVQRVLQSRGIRRVAFAFHEAVQEMPFQANRSRRGAPAGAPAISLPGAYSLFHDNSEWEYALTNFFGSLLSSRTHIVITHGDVFNQALDHFTRGRTMVFETPVTSYLVFNKERQINQPATHLVQLTDRLL